MTKLERKHYDLNKQKVNEALSTVYPEYKFEGKGIVTCGGSEKYFVPAVIMIKILRYLGCTLPVQIWYLGDNEMNDNMREIASELENVELVDAFKVAEEFPMRRLGGWESKVFSVMYSRFKEVLFIDSDNIPVRDPSFLFKIPLYTDTGSLFWPDVARFSKSRRIWKICDVPYRDEPEFETGQMVIDKSRCWDALMVTRHLNEYSDFYYQNNENGYIWGDKDTFRMAWHMVDRAYSIIPRKVRCIPETMLQHDGSKKLLFQHRNLAKWKLFGKNPRIPGFIHEEKCLEFLNDIRGKWKVQPDAQLPDLKDPDLEKIYKDLIEKRYFIYHRLGKDKRCIELRPDFKIGKGGTDKECSWTLSKRGQYPVIIIIRGKDGPVASVKYQYSDTWTGNTWSGAGRIQLRTAKG